jgi:cytochrome P450
MTETVQLRADEADPDAAPPPFPFPRGPLSEPPAEYAERRATCPLGTVTLPSGDEAVLLVTHRDVVAAFAEPRLSRDLSAPGSPRMTRDASVFDDPNLIVNKNGEDHLRIRRIVASAFTPRRVETWKPAIRAVADELIDELAADGAPADIVGRFCFQLPVRIMCKLLGVPERDAAQFRSWSHAIALGADMDPQEREQQVGAFVMYVNTLLAQRRAEPGTELVDDLIAARDGDDRLSETELFWLVLALIVAGNESTSNTFGRSLLTLLRGDRGPWLELVANPDLIGRAVDELTRLNVLGVGALRLATEDVELPSGVIRAGQAVVLETGAAARDASVFPDPDAARFDRDAVAVPVFGAGAHYCLGVHLAKAELQIGLRALVERLPGLRLAVAPDEVRFSEGELLSSLLELPVAW